MCSSIALKCGHKYICTLYIFILEGLKYFLVVEHYIGEKTILYSLTYLLLESEERPSETQGGR